MIHGSGFCVKAVLGHWVTSEMKPPCMISFRKNSRGTCLAGFVGNPKSSLA